LTALGDDELAQTGSTRLREHHGVELYAATRTSPQRRCFTFLDDAAERTITVLGERIIPLREDRLPWDALGELDGIYLTGGDAGAVRAARAARMLVATPRAMETLADSGVQLDVLVGSAIDAGEVYEEGMLDPQPRVVVRTAGERGGTWELTGEPPAWVADGERSGSWAATPLPGPPVDAYGCGDSFAAGLTYGLASGMQLHDAIELCAGKSVVEISAEARPIGVVSDRLAGVEEDRVHRSEPARIRRELVEVLDHQLLARVSDVEAAEPETSCIGEKFTDVRRRHPHRIEIEDAVDVRQALSAPFLLVHDRSQGGSDAGADQTAEDRITHQFFPSRTQTNSTAAL